MKLKLLLSVIAAIPLIGVDIGTNLFTKLYAPQVSTIQLENTNIGYVQTQLALNGPSILNWICFGFYVITLFVIWKSTIINLYKTPVTINEK